ncbi:phage tail fiber protein [Candidatus Pelagibacter sp.]|nr:phage tail fiber protein [Candidatus Pelagibacter sp.]
MSFNARVSYIADGNTSTFAITFNFIDSTHVKVFLDGVANTNFTVSGSNVVMNSNPANGVVVMIKRETPTDARLVDFQDGSVLTESDLDKSADQNFFIAQEVNDESQSAMKLGTDDTFDAQNKRIKNLADPVNNGDAVNKSFISTNLPNINTVAGISTQVTNVANSLSAITTANSNSTNINTVATNIANVNTVATNISDVQKVAQDLNEAVSEIETVADDLNEVSSEIDTVGQNIANVNTVAGLNSEITTLAGITNLTNLANAHANVTTVANNLSGVNSFAERYRVQAGVPSSSNDAGDLVFDLTAQKLKVFDGNSYQLAGSSVNGTSQRFKFVATASQTTFSGADANGNTLAYDVASGTAFADIYLNGVKLDTSDFTATNGTSIVLGSGATVNDILQVVAYGTFELASFSAGNITSGIVPVVRGGTGKTTSDLSGNQGKALVVNSAQNGFDLSTTSSAEVYGFETYYTPSTLIKTVTVQSVSGSNKYFIDGVQQDTLELYEGNTYVFNYPSAHPFKFSTTPNGSHAGGSEYTTGVTHNSSTQVTIVVSSNAPTLYYYCSSHSGMGGQANTPVPAVNSLRVITTNQGADNISQSQYANFDESLFSASGFVFSISNGELIATI